MAKLRREIAGDEAGPRHPARLPAAARRAVRGDRRLHQRRQVQPAQPAHRAPACWSRTRCSPPSTRPCAAPRPRTGAPYTLTDTVGFVRPLPHQLVEAFRSTLEEVADADLLLHVVDAAHRDPEGQLAAVRDVLRDIEGADGHPGAGGAQQGGPRRPRRRSTGCGAGRRSVVVSARTGAGLDELRRPDRRRRCPARARRWTSSCPTTAATWSAGCTPRARSSRAAHRRGHRAARRGRPGHARRLQSIRCTLGARRGSRLARRGVATGSRGRRAPSSAATSTRPGDRPARRARDVTGAGRWTPGTSPAHRTPPSCSTSRSAALGGRRRDGQHAMAAPWPARSSRGEHLLVQAGTGTGKSLGYLVPAVRHAVLAGERVIVSTATLALQRQMMTRDLPLVAAALAPHLRAPRDSRCSRAGTTTCAGTGSPAATRRRSRPALRRWPEARRRRAPRADGVPAPRRAGAPGAGVGRGDRTG